MTPSTSPVRTARSLRPDYGVDAPHVIRNLVIIGVVIFAIAIWWGHRVNVTDRMARTFKWSGYATATACLLEAVLMIFYGKVGKFIHRDKMMQLRTWRGDERVLDVGTGRGLLLVAAAKLAPAGNAVGIDIWRSEDLTGNTADGTIANLQLEGVDGRTELRSMPAQAMTFGDGTFDVVVSNLCLHNIEARRERDAACREIARVLKPRGQALISDFRHTEQYAATFRSLGCTARRTGIDLATFPWLRTVVVEKS